jgi:hypothetical protein
MFKRKRVQPPPAASGGPGATVPQDPELQELDQLIAEELIQRTQAQRGPAVSASPGVPGMDVPQDPELIELEQLMIEELLGGESGPPVSSVLPADETAELLAGLLYPGPARTATFQRLMELRRSGVAVNAPPTFVLLSNPSSGFPPGPPS